MITFGPITFKASKEFHKTMSKLWLEIQALSYTSKFVYHCLIEMKYSHYDVKNLMTNISLTCFMYLIMPLEEAHASTY